MNNHDEFGIYSNYLLYVSIHYNIL